MLIFIRNILNRYQVNFVAASGSLVGAALGTSSLHGITIDFTQGGFAEEASVAGYFTGEDSDGDGRIEYSSLGLVKEVTDFSLSFSGNSAVESFTLGFNELQNLVFQYPGDNLLGNDTSNDPFGGSEIMTVFNETYFYQSGIGTGVDLFGEAVKLTGDGAETATTTLIEVDLPEGEPQEPVPDLSEDAIAASSYDSWVSEIEWSESPTLRGSDPDEDGRDNLKEFTQGTHPLLPDTSHPINLAISRNGGLTIEYALRAANSGLNTIIEKSSDLIEWEPAPLGEPLSDPTVSEGLAHYQAILLAFSGDVFYRVTSVEVD